MRKAIWAASAAAMALVSTAAWATVTFDSTTGLGFVGKGDVQVPFGWNNAKAQAQAYNVSFDYDSSASYDVTIEFSTGNPDHPKSIEDHVVTQDKSFTVNASVASDPRKTGQYTGWNLRGLGTPTVTGDPVPTVGDSCPNGDLGDCVVTAVTSVSSSGGLYVSDTATGDGPTLIYGN